MSEDSPEWPFEEAVGFEDGHAEAVAAECDLDPDRLRTVAAAHQDLMGRLPGVENLVYEWRKQFDATVLIRTETAYVVDAPEWAWEEFVDSLDAEPAVIDALAQVHDRMAKSHDGVDAVEGATPIVLVRQ